MTPDSNLPPGRELDALVAEKVFGILGVERFEVELNAAQDTLKALSQKPT